MMAEGDVEINLVRYDYEQVFEVVGRFQGRRFSERLDMSKWVGVPEFVVRYAVAAAESRVRRVLLDGGGERDSKED